MKKLLSIAMCLCLILSTFTFVGITASADTDDYLNYFVSNGEATVTGTVTGYDYSISGDITIPPTLGGYPVTTIYDAAFFSCDSLTSVTIPDTVISIGDIAFSGCDSLTSVSIGDSVTSIGIKAFADCYALTSVTIPDSVTTIGFEAFSACESIKSVTIPDGVTSIDDGTFEFCRSLTSISIPDGLTSIGDMAFYGCGSLTSISIPDGLTSIGDSAFCYCDSIKSVTIPDSVTSIGEEAFCGCESLTSATISNGLESIPAAMFLECYSLTSVTIPDSVTSIGDGAFSDCESLTSVTIPDSVTSIGDDAFSYCNENFVIIAYEGSYAHSYAQSNNIKFEKIEQHTHKYTSKVTKQPTCAKKGVKTYTCECGDSYTEDIATLAHKVKTVNKKSATYFAKGYTGDKKCSVCGKVVAKGKAVAQLKLKTPKFSLKGATKKFTVKYTTVSGATGFEVRYKLGSGKYKTIKVNTKKSMSKVISKLKKGKYTVQVRAFVKSGSKTAYSSWASAKKVTVK